MAKKREHPIREVVPPEADDLQVINGIGPAVEHRLHGVGIFTFAQLAALSPADIAASVADLTGLTAERIIRQNWIGQARHLAGVAGSSQTEEALAPVPHDVPTSAEISEESMPVAADAGVFADEETTIIGDAKDSSAIIEESNDAQEVTTIEDAPSAPLQPAQGLSGTLQIRAMELVGSTLLGSHRLVHYDEPFDIRLTLDLSGLSVPEDTQLQYRVSIYGKNRVSRSGRFARESEGSFTPADTVTIELDNNILSEGTYQLAASVILALPHMQLTPKPGSMALIDGGVVQVY
jgi:hypothetical protein